MQGWTFQSGANSQNYLVGKRFSNFRAAWGDTWTNPLKGMFWREQRRLAKLASSGQRILDAEDARRVRELAFWNLRLYGRFLTVVTVAVPLSLAIDGLSALLGHPLRPWWHSVVSVAAYLFAVLGLRHLRRQQTRTCQANEWNDSHAEPLL